jgi:signal transduction histidine kinase
VSPFSRLDAEDLQQLAAVVERLPTGVIMVSRRRQEVMYVNVAARRMLHPRVLRRGRPIPDPWPDFSLPAYVDTLVTSGLGRETHVEAAPGETYIVSGVSARDASVAVVLLDDVSRRERRRRAEREFVANAAHELLTPLTGIVGAAHVLEAGAKEVPEDRDHFIGHIARECEQLTRIARSLLVLARAQSGEEPPRLDVFPLCVILEEMAVILAEVEASPVTVDCPEELTVLVDTDLFRQALTNLIRNAAEHGSGDAIEVSAVEVEGDRVEIQVVSDGTRLAPDDIPRLHRRFRTGAGRDGGGFGLGISIAVQSIEAIGGTLTLDEGAGHGVVARIDVPSGRVSTS